MKELLVYARPDAQEVNILVPKRRGEGYLKTPLGHHHNELAKIAYEIGHDIYGLDGSLDIQTGFLWLTKIDALLAQIVPPIANYYGMTWRQVEESEFWELHPLRSFPLDVP